MTEAAAPAISVVIPTFNRLPRLKRVLEAISQQTLDRSMFEVVVVSDGSSDGTDEYLETSTPIPVVHGRQTNAGPAAARNHGVQLARGRLILFIDDDVVATPTLLERHLAGHGDEDNRVVIGPMLNAPDFPYTAWIAWEQAMLYKQYSAMRRGDYEPTFRQFYTGNASVPRELLLRAGGFDVAFRRAEDVELAYRLDQLGAAFVFDEEAAAHHWAERSFESWLASAQAYGRNDITFARDHDQQWLIPTLADEFGKRNIVTRALVRTCLPHPKLEAIAVRGLRAFSIATRRAPKISGFALSGLYGLTYYVGAATELGDRAGFWRTLSRTMPNDASAETNRVLLTVSGVIDPGLRAAIDSASRPRADFIEMAERLGADLIDYGAARRDAKRMGVLIRRLGGDNALLAWVCFRRRDRYDAVVTDGEQVGIPYAALARLVRRRTLPTHSMIVHIISVPKKALIVKALRLRHRIDQMFVYSSWQRQFAVSSLGMDPERVKLTSFMVDSAFFSLDQVTPARRRMICAAGLEFRDYNTLTDAVRGLDVDVVVAAASPWSKRSSELDDAPLPPNVSLCKLSLFELRQLYADAMFVVVPLQEVDFQAGVTTILEAMSMSRAVVCSKTRGQTDVVIDGETGRYVESENADALRRVIVELLDDDDATARLGKNGREWIQANADIEIYAERLAREVAAVPSPARR